MGGHEGYQLHSIHLPFSLTIMKNLENKTDCYWFPIIKDSIKSYKEYRKQIKNPSEYDCTKCKSHYQFKCPAYISAEEMNKKNVDEKDL